MYYLRCETDNTAPERVLRSGRSLDEWGAAGMDAWGWLDHATDQELYEIARRTGARPTCRDEAWEATRDADESIIVGVLRLEPWPHGGWARWLPGVCAIEEYAEEPSREEAVARARKSGYGYLGWVTLYEGDPAGTDPAEGWPLFQPQQLVWIIKL